MGSPINVGRRTVGFTTQGSANGRSQLEQLKEIN